MFSEKLVSICMPVFNGSRFVHSSVESLLRQSYRNLEIIVVDDGSTDSTLEMLHSFDDSRLRVISNADNQGNLVRRNQAFEEASGDFIAIMDADDLCSPDRVVRQVAALNSGFELCGSYVANGQSPALTKNVWQLPREGNQLVRMALFGSPMANPSVMMTRDLLTKHDFRFDLDMFPAADYNAWARLIFIERTPAYIVPAPLIFRRIHGASISHTKSKLMAKKADEVRQKLLEHVNVPADLIKLHNKAINMPVNDDELVQLHHLHQTVLRDAMPDVFDSGSVYYRQSNKRIPLGVTIEPTEDTSAAAKTKAEKPKLTAKVSVIVPAYNVGDLLKECVASVIETCSNDVEVIIVDDGSTDNTPQICKALSRKYGNRLQLVRQQNGGLSAARNAGVDHSAAEYVFFLDGDDFMAPGAIDKLHELAQSARADVVVSTHSAYYEDTKKTVPRHEVTETKTYTNAIFDHFADRSFGYIAANKLIRRELLIKVPFHRGIYHEDELFCPELFLSAQRVATLAEELYFYRQRSGSITSKVTEKHVRDWLFIANRVMEIGFRFGLNTQSSPGFAKLMAYLLLAARNKLDRMDTCSDAFADEVFAATGRLEAQLMMVCDVHDPRRAPGSQLAQSKTPDSKTVQASWREVCLLQNRLAQLTKNMETAGADTAMPDKHPPAVQG